MVLLQFPLIEFPLHVEPFPLVAFGFCEAVGGSLQLDAVEQEDALLACIDGSGMLLAEREDAVPGLGVEAVAQSGARLLQHLLCFTFLVAGACRQHDQQERERGGQGVFDG